MAEGLDRTLSGRLLWLGRHWKLDGDTMVCLGCRRAIHVDRDEEGLRHGRTANGDDCPNAESRHPWSALGVILNGMPGFGERTQLREKLAAAEARAARLEEALREYAACFDGVRDERTREPEIWHADLCRRAADELTRLRAEVARLREERDRYRVALEEIVDPVQCVVDTILGVHADGGADA